MAGPAISRRRGATAGAHRSIRFLQRCLKIVLALSVLLPLWLYYRNVHDGLSLGTPPAPPSSAASRPFRAVDASSDPVATVAYAISLTGCGAGPGLIDGAAVLAHSIHANSHPRLPSSRYGAKLYALIHPEAAACAEPLRHLGYEPLVRPTPVEPEAIRGRFLREHVAKTGCCGEKEFVKLWAYALTEHPIAVHLDLDYLVLRPLDDLFDAMMAGEGGKGVLYEKIREGRVRPHDGPWTEEYRADSKGRVDAYFTRDYNMVQPGRQHVGVQGGFLVLRPDQKAYDEYVDIITEGDFDGGWGGKYGGFYGAMQFQGVVPYYYDTFHPRTAVELNRCRYNTMADNPMNVRGDQGEGKCRDSRETCEDCRKTDPADVYTAHFTVCQKPWICISQKGTGLYHPFCRQMHAKWFEAREEMERGWAEQYKDYVPATKDGKYDEEHFRGACKSGGEKGYIPVVVPKVDGELVA